MPRFAILNAALVENVVVANSTPTVPGRTVVGPLGAQQAVGPGDSYDGTNFTARVPTTQETARGAAPAKLTAGYPVLRQWAIDGRNLSTNMIGATRSMTAAEEAEVIRRLGLFFDYFADVLAYVQLDS